MIKHRKINIPIIAIGGIKLFDVERLLKMGLHGVAVSSGINLSPIREIIIKQFIEKIENTESGQVTNCR
ncbi:MAG: thiamine phosphate synthase [Bacteroidetes bacterium]|nr:thiamine phosphate synthase [Bacteroidota bacterium]